MAPVGAGEEWWLCECVNPHCRICHGLRPGVANRVRRDGLAVVWRDCANGPAAGAVLVKRTKRYALYRNGGGVGRGRRWHD